MSYREVSCTSEDYIQVGEEEWEMVQAEKLYPSRIEGRKDLGDDILYLPSDLSRIYRETAAALINDSCSGLIKLDTKLGGNLTT